MSDAAVADGGEDTKVLWVRLMDSTTTTGRQRQGHREVQGAVPDLRHRHGRVHHRQPRQARHVRQRRPGLQPGHQLAHRPRRQLRAAGAPGHPERRSSPARSRSTRRAPTSPACSGSRTASRPPTSAPRSSSRAGSSPTPWSSCIAGQEVETGRRLRHPRLHQGQRRRADPRRQAYLTADWFGGDAYKQSFLTAWGVE